MKKSKICPNTPAARIFDVFASIFLIAVLSPLWIIISIIIASSGGWPIIFCQKRVGFKGKEFIMYKFRTLRTSQWCKDRTFVSKKDDYRVFPFGKILRSTGLDELPQILNVIKGEMKFVGPRPFPPMHTDIPDFTKRYDIIPGITGLTQIIHTDRKGDKRVYHLDLLYMRKMSLGLDLKILLLTLIGIFRAKRI